MRVTSVLVLPINRVTDASVAFRIATLKATSLSASFSSRKQSRVLTLLFFFLFFSYIQTSVYLQCLNVLPGSIVLSASFLEPGTVKASLMFSAGCGVGVTADTKIQVSQYTYKQYNQNQIQYGSFLPVIVLVLMMVLLPLNVSLFMLASRGAAE